MGWSPPCWTAATARTPAMWNWVTTGLPRNPPKSPELASHPNSQGKLAPQGWSPLLGPLGMSVSCLQQRPIEADSGRAPARGHPCLSSGGSASNNYRFPFFSPLGRKSHPWEVCKPLNSSGLVLMVGAQGGQSSLLTCLFFQVEKSKKKVLQEV